MFWWALKVHSLAPLVCFLCFGLGLTCELSASLLIPCLPLVAMPPWPSGTGSSNGSKPFYIHLYNFTFSSYGLSIVLLVILSDLICVCVCDVHSCIHACMQTHESSSHMCGNTYVWMHMNTWRPDHMCGGYTWHTEVRGWCQLFSSISP